MIQVSQPAKIHFSTWLISTYWFCYWERHKADQTRNAKIRHVWAIKHENFFEIRLSASRCPNECLSCVQLLTCLNIDTNNNSHKVVIYTARIGPKSVCPSSFLPTKLTKHWQVHKCISLNSFIYSTLHTQFIIIRSFIKIIIVKETSPPFRYRTKFLQQNA